MAINRHLKVPSAVRAVVRELVAEHLPARSVQTATAGVLLDRDARRLVREARLLYGNARA